MRRPRNEGDDWDGFSEPPISVAPGEIKMETEEEMGDTDFSLGLDEGSLTDPEHAPSSSLAYASDHYVDPQTRSTAGKILFEDEDGECKVDEDLDDLEDDRLEYREDLEEELEDELEDELEQEDDLEEEGNSYTRSDPSVRNYTARRKGSGTDTNSTAPSSGQSFSRRDRSNVKPATRHHHSWQKVLVRTYLTIVIAIIAYTIYKFVSLSLQDGLWIRCLAFVYLPAIALFLMFGVLFAVNTVHQLFGPVAHIRRNSQWYSAIPPIPPKDPGLLPTVTVQIPVFKESLEGVIIPSVRSVVKACRYYTRRGGKANVFINDDGLQIVDEDERGRRIAFYERNGLAYVARPPDNIRSRRGLFKKASNMNYCLNVASKVEEVIAAAMKKGQRISPAEGLYKVWAGKSFNKEFLAGGDVYVGDLILLVDADTRVPKQSLYKTAPEFLESDQLAFTQHLTFPMRTDYNYWENTIAHFTETIYFAIMFATAGGDPPPLVGHNAFLRWSAIKSVTREDPHIDGYKLYWAEDRVSEDFDLSLRLLSRNYTGRYITYTGTGFQEGVSLTVHDEIIRLRKYAYGASEMMFNKVGDILTCKGLISKSYREFLWSTNVPWYSKVDITAYLGTYFAMSVAVLATWINVVLWAFVPSSRKELISSLDILLTVTIVFGGMATFGLGVLKYRLNYRGSAEVGILFTIMNEIRHIPVLMLFFNSLPFHLSIAVFRYFFNLRMTWGATVKEKEVDQHLWSYVLVTVKRYRSMYAAMSIMTLAFGALLYLSPASVNDVHVLVPILVFIVGHVLGPFLLDPTLMRFVY